MKIDNGEFYVMDCGETKHVFGSLQDAVSALRKVDFSDDEDGPEIVVFSHTDSRWVVSPVSWKKIGALLVSGGVADAGA